METRQRWPSSRRVGRCNQRHYLWRLLVVVTLIMLVGRSTANAFIDTEKQQQQQDNKQLVKTLTTQLPLQSILLENGLTTFVSSLEEYLAHSEQHQVTTTTTDQSAAIATDNYLSTSVGPNDTVAPAQSIPKQPEVSRPQRLLSPEATSTAVEVTNRQQEHETSNKHRHQESGHAHSPHSAHGSAGSSGNSSGPKPIPQYWQVKSLLNVTHDYPLAYSQIICGYVWPLIAAITMFTNLMIVFVLTQHDMRTPTNVVLTAIAIADIIPIVVPVPWFVYLFAMGNEKKVLYPPVLCYFYQHSTRSVSEVFYFLSTWLNVLLAVHDYLTACWPQLAKKYCQIRFVVMEIIWLTMWAFLLNLPQALKLVYKPVKFIYNDQLTWGCRALQAKWFKELVGEYVALYDDIFAAIIVLFVDGGPALALIALTALLIRQLHRQRIRGHLLMEQARTASKRRRERHRQQEYESSARVMIFVLLAFLAVKIPFATTYTLMIIQSRFEIHFVENLNDFQKAITLIDLVFVLSYPLNFTIFCCCSKKFRHKCVQLLGECERKKKRLLVKLNDSFNTSFNSSHNSRDDLASTGDEQAAARKQRHHSLATVSSMGTSIEGVVACTNHHHKSIEELRRLSELERRERLTCNGRTSQLVGRQLQVSSSSSAERLHQQHHHQQQQQQQWQQHHLDPKFRALLEEGNICLECIMHYERIKHSSSKSRRSSSESSNWPPPPPPPLPQLPSIHITQYPMSSGSIMADCESIDERPGSEDAATLEARQSATTNSSEVVWNQEAQVESGEQVNNLVELSPEQFGRSGTGSANLRVRRSEEEDRSVELGGRGRLPRQAHRGSSSARGRSDPGSPGGGLLRKLSDLVLRSEAGGSSSAIDEQVMDTSASSIEQQDDVIMSRIAERHRSLSMSNSKLSALPDATGFLADILKATLLAPPSSTSSSWSGEQHGLQGQSNSQNRASSLGSTNLSRRRREHFARNEKGR